MRTRAETRVRNAVVARRTKSLLALLESIRLHPALSEDRRDLERRRAVHAAIESAVRYGEHKSKRSQ
jgi:hypothetical protein